MNISLIRTEEEYAAAAKFAVSHGFDTPYAREIIQAVNKEGNLLGIVGIDLIPCIEPLISSSIDVTNNLYHTALGMILGMNVNRVECYVPDQDFKVVGNLLERRDFQFIEKTNRFVKTIKSQWKH